MNLRYFCSLCVAACLLTSCAVPNSVKRFYVATYDLLAGSPAVDELTVNGLPAELPANPVLPPDRPGSISEQWSLRAKEYDNTWRIRWPSSLNAQANWSRCTIAGVRADFRNYDEDNGAKRPSYFAPYFAVKFPVLCVLYGADGEVLAWFRAERPNEDGRLP